MLPFQGNGYYCYANSLHMALRGAGANAPEPGFLECLTTMPWGHTYLRLEDGPLCFFSSPDINPDTGLSLALRTLGWTADEAVGGTAEAAMQRLTHEAPVLVGPVDLGYLTYNPNHRNLSGVDHYVVVMAVQDDQVFLHDPAGFPCAMIPTVDFLLAWQADNVPYKRGPFTCRSGFRKVREIDRATMISDTLTAVRQTIASNPSGPVVFGGVEALALLAADLRGKVPANLASHLVWFALPLAARRALDAAAFLSEAGLKSAAAIQAEQARVYGQANYLAVQGRWGEVATRIEQLVRLEADLVAAIGG